jgi:hypothetical protein
MFVWFISEGGAFRTLDTNEDVLLMQSSNPAAAELPIDATQYDGRVLLARGDRVSNMLTSAEIVGFLAQS